MSPKVESDFELGEIIEIPEMPSFMPKDVTPPGVERAVLDAKTQSIVNAFSIQDQQISWIAKNMVIANRNLSVVMDAVRYAIDAAEKAKAMAESVAKDVTDMQNKPYKAVVKTLGAIALIFLGGIATALAERVLLKH